jgi:gas vesicle protein
MAGAETETKNLSRLRYYRFMADKHRGTFIGGIIIGAAIGTVTGLLIAPRTGRDTRKILNKTVSAVPQMAEDIASSVQFQADRIADTASDRWHGTLDRLATAISAGIVASQSVRKLNDPTHLKSSSKVDE